MSTIVDAKTLVWNASSEAEAYCYELSNMELFLGDENMVQIWMMDEGGFNIETRTPSEIANMFSGLEETDDSFGIYGLNVYGYLTFKTYDEVAEEIVDHLDSCGWPDDLKERCKEDGCVEFDDEDIKNDRTLHELIQNNAD